MPGGGACVCPAALGWGSLAWVRPGAPCGEPGRDTQCLLLGAGGLRAPVESCNESNCVLRFRIGKGAQCFSYLKGYRLIVAPNLTDNLLPPPYPHLGKIGK